MLAWASCEPTIEEANLIGEWRVDSVYVFENGFDYTQEGVEGRWPRYTYQENGKVTEMKDGMKKEFMYRFAGKDSLLYLSPQQEVMNGYKILHFSPKALVLKKMRVPKFPSPGQQMYEVRYFSKVED